jgi:hypothetical protein
MTARGVPMQDLQQEELHGGDGREHAVAPAGIAHLAAHRQDGFGLEQQGPLAGEALQDGRDMRNHLMTSCTIGMCVPHTYRRDLVAPNSRDIPGYTACVLPNFMPFDADPGSRDAGCTPSRTPWGASEESCLLGSVHSDFH